MAMFGKMKDQYDFVKKAREIQKKLKKEIVESESKLIRIRMNGEQKIESVEILVDTVENTKELERDIKQVLESSIDKSQKIAAAMMKDITGGMGMPF